MEVHGGPPPLGTKQEQRQPPPGRRALDCWRRSARTRARARWWRGIRRTAACCLLHGGHV